MDKITFVLDYRLLPSLSYGQILFNQTFGTHCSLMIIAIILLAFMLKTQNLPFLPVSLFWKFNLDLINPMLINYMILERGQLSRLCLFPHSALSLIKLRIYQVSACKMEPRSGYIFCWKSAGRLPDYLNV